MGLGRCLLGRFVLHHHSFFGRERETLGCKSPPSCTARASGIVNFPTLHASTIVGQFRQPEYRSSGRVEGSVLAYCESLSTRGFAGLFLFSLLSRDLRVKKMDFQYRLQFNSVCVDRFPRARRSRFANCSQASLSSVVTRLE